MLRFNSNTFCRKSRCFRRSWDTEHYLTYDGENFIEHKRNCAAHIWYWQTTDDFAQAVQDLTATDWSYV